MKIKSNAFWQVNDGKGYFKIGKNIYTLSGIDIEMQREFWEKIKNKKIQDLEEVMKENDLFGRYVSFLKMIGAFCDENNMWISYGKENGMDLKGVNDKVGSLSIKIRGDEDLTEYYKKYISEDFKVIDDEGREDLAIIVARKDNINNVLKWNDYYVDKNIPFVVIILEAFVAYIGPFVIPKETSCFRCAYKREQKNIFFNNSTYEIFNNDKFISKEPIPIFNLKAAMGLTEVILFKYIFRKLKNQNQFSNLNSIMEFDWMKDTIVQHQIIINLKCDCCFPEKENNKSDIWLSNM